MSKKRKNNSGSPASVASLEVTNTRKFNKLFLIVVAVLTSLVIVFVFLNFNKTAQNDIALVEQQKYLVVEDNQVLVNGEVVFDSREMQEQILVGKNNLVVQFYTGQVLVKDLTTDEVTTIDLTLPDGSNPELSSLKEVSDTEFGILASRNLEGVTQQVLTLYNVLDGTERVMGDVNGENLPVMAWAASEDGFVAYQVGNETVTYLYDTASETTTYLGEYDNLGGFIQKARTSVFWATTNDPSKPVSTYVLASETASTVISPNLSSREVIAQIVGVPKTDIQLWRVTGIEPDGATKQYLVLDKGNGDVKEFFTLEDDEDFDGDIQLNDEGTVVAVPVTSSRGYRTVLLNSETGAVIDVVENAKRLYFIN